MGIYIVVSVYSTQKNYLCFTCLILIAKTSFSGINEKLYLYKLLSGHLIGIASRHYQPTTKLTFTPCGNYFASGGEDGFVYLWSLSSFIESLHKIDTPQVEPHFVLGQHSDKVDTALCSVCWDISSLFLLDLY